MSLIETNVHLIVPQLFQPLSLWYKDFGFEPEAHHLSTLLSQYDTIKSHKAYGVDASLFACLGVVDAELPSAYYRIQTHLNEKIISRGFAETTSEKSDAAPQGEKMIKTGGGVSRQRSAELSSNNKQNRTLLCADPVHLEVGMNDITLTDRMTDLSNDEAKEIIDALNEHFNQDGLEFIFGTAEQWYLSLPSNETVSTTPVDEVLRKNIANYLPHSETRNWQIIQNETQMLLHSLAINSQREMQGLPTVNSLWFWGAGKPQKIEQQSVNAIYSSIKSKGEMLAKAAQCDCHEITKETDFKGVIKALKGNNIFILDTLRQAATFDDVELYQRELSELDEKIIKPLLASWSSGEIKLKVDGCDGSVLGPFKAPAWKFWAKKPKPLLDVVNDISL